MTGTDCEGTETGYRCWAAGEYGFALAVGETVAPIVRDAVRNEIQHLIDLETKTHSKHHEYIQSQIDANRISAERWEKIKTQVLGWGVIAIVGWLGKLVLDAVAHYRGQP